LFADADLKSAELNKQEYTEAEIAEWEQRIRQYIEQDQPFLNPDLRLSEMARHFNVNISTFSTLMNVCFDKNFNDLINEYRIRTLLKKADDGLLKQYTLLSLALESGFNSKTTFNRAFKKYTGVSPTDYLIRK
jgi:AraC-like DNA-binding protein